jgi:hypothetical protein
MAPAEASDARRGAGGRFAGRWPRRLAAAAIAGAAVLLAAPAGAAITPPSGLFRGVAPGYQTATLTRDGADTYRLTATSGSVTASATATNLRGNSRGVFWPTGQAAIAKQQACASFTARQGPTVQQGLALRIKQMKNGAVRAITVTNNVFTIDVQRPWAFNVHVWNTKRAQPFQYVDSFNLEQVFAPQGVALSLPWRLCARVQGRLLMFQAWREGQPRPSWSSTVHGGSIKLPGGTGYAGQAGWYIGHLFAGDSAAVNHLTTGAPTTVPN